MLTKLRENGLTGNQGKTKICREKLTFLGHEISAKWIGPCAEKLDAIRNLPTPRNVRQVRGLCGFLNFYRKFIPNFAAKIAPINELLRKGVKFKWERKQHTALEELKAAFESHVLIAHPNFNREFWIRCDASALGISAILGQEDENGHEGVVAMCSRGLKRYERAYTTTELELLAIVFATEKFRQYILGFPTILFTDHQALTFMRQCENLNARIKRWALAIEQYDLRISYIRGADNGPADYLSRNICGEREDYEEPGKVIVAILNKCK